jgi:uncharacterized protein YndB with AHSA1/START domain
MANENENLKGRTLGTTRIFNASIEDVWKVWTQPEHLNNWWGPVGFNLTTHKHEFKTGGAWSFIMHGPNGANFQNEIVYGEIIHHKKIVLDHVSMPKFVITATFTVISDKRTQVDFMALFDDAKTVDAVKDFAIQGNVQHQMKFEIELAKITGEPVPNEFVISREFKADINTMWKMFTEPKHMASWYGPKEIKIGHCDMNFNRGGHYHFSMIATDGSESWGKIYYVDIVNNLRLIYLNTFSNKEGEITRHPMAPLMPKELLTFVNFSSLENGKVRVEIRWLPINAIPEEIKFFNEMHGSFNMGWTGSLDRLESVIGEKK